MKTNFIKNGSILFLSLMTLISCNEAITKKQTEKKTIERLTEAEKADLERGSFDKLPDHNDLIVGCWMIDKKRSSSQLWNSSEIDALFFFKEHKRFSIYDSTETTESESRIGFFRFYNDELVFEITEGEPFQDVWKIQLSGEKIIAKNKRNPNHILYLNKTNKKSTLSYR